MRDPGHQIQLVQKLTRIDGIGLNTALVILSEVGSDLSKFPSEKHFSAWAGLCGS